jgi:hypothetical protein
MIFNFIMGAAGLVLAGDSFSRGIRERSIGIFVVGGAELIIGLYFMIAASGG